MLYTYTYGEIPHYEMLKIHKLILKKSFYINEQEEKECNHAKPIQYKLQVASIITLKMYMFVYDVKYPYTKLMHFPKFSNLEKISFNNGMESNECVIIIFIC